MLTLHASTEANQKNSPLLRLPAELRNKIYVLAAETNIMLIDDGPPCPRFTGILSPLLLSCRQTYNETRKYNTRAVLRLSGRVSAVRQVVFMLRYQNADIAHVHTIEFSRSATARYSFQLKLAAGAWSEAWKYGFLAVQRLVFDVSGDMDVSQLRKLFWRTSFRNDELDIVFRRVSRDL